MVSMSKLLPPRGDVISFLTDAGRAVHAREIASALAVPEKVYPRFQRLLEDLASERAIRRLSGDRFRAERPEPTRPKTRGWEGILRLHPRGFGFVNAAGQPDVYVAPDGIGPAMHGDFVRVAVIGESSRGVEGRIESVIKRRSARVAGVLRRRGKSSWLEPDDARIRGPIVLSKAAEGEDGDAAVAQITRFPELTEENPEGELVAVLGTPGDPNVEVAKILVREQIVEEHPEKSIREAETMAARLLRAPSEGRVDLREVPLPTIDPEDARDHDDAVWVERQGEGYRAWIAIADVSEYVQPGTGLDDEALARGCTIYLPDRAIPMLPRALAGDLCSLLPERDRLCLCVIVDLDKDASVQNYEIVEGVMRSAAMLTYGGVARALGFTDKPQRSAQAEALKRELRCVDELTRKLRKIRMRRGALDLDLPEVKVVLDERTGAPVGVKRRAEDEGIKRAYQMVEELMLLANELVAKWLTKRRSPAIFRIHGKPDETKLQRLGEVAAKLGVTVELEDMLEPLGLAKWLRKIQDHPRKQVLEMLLLRSLKQAAYDINNIGHFGLASENYLHFTSPIRRYPDLLVHRQVKHLLRGGRIDLSENAIEQLRTSATNSSERERAAMDVEREVVDLYRALYMRAHIGEVFEGTVSALVGSGVFVSLDDPFVDVLVRFESLGPDQYNISDDELSAVGVHSGDTVSLGDRMVVHIEDVAILRRAVFGRRVLTEAAVDRFTGPSKRRPVKGGRRQVVDAPPRARAGKSKAGSRSAARGAVAGGPKRKGDKRSKETRKRRG